MKVFINRKGLLSTCVALLLALIVLPFGATSVQAEVAASSSEKGKNLLDPRGGTSQSNPLSVQESVYRDVYARTFMAAGAPVWAVAAPSIMSVRYESFAQSTLLDGRIMVTGGTVNWISSKDVYLFDPVTNLWQAGPPMPDGKSGHRQSTLKDGRVLVTGGSSKGISYLFDPATNSWSEAARVPTSDGNYSQSVLNDGRVFIVGGTNGKSSDKTYLYDPKTNKWSEGASLPIKLHEQSQTTLLNGKVFITGGITRLNYDDDGYINYKIILYNPISNSWEYGSNVPFPNSRRAAETYEQSLTLPDGRVMVTVEGITHIYSPDTDKWISTAVLPMTTNYTRQSLLPDGRVFLTGGYNYTSQVSYILTLNIPPTVTVQNTNQTVWSEPSHNIVSLSGKVYDANNDNVTVSATLAGRTKTVAIPNTASSPDWTLQWDVTADNLAVGEYTNIPVTVNDGTAGSSGNYTGTITIGRAPDRPSNLRPGGLSAGQAQLISTETPALGWTFSDADPGDEQSAFQVILQDTLSGKQIYDSGWILSGSGSFTVPSKILARGSVISWTVRVKDKKGIPSAFSLPSYLRFNSLPVALLKSYTDGQTLGNNVLTFSWDYKDAEGHIQTDYQVVGSNDGWKSWSYNSGEINSNATIYTTTPLLSGSWNFAVRVKDGTDWSEWAYRNNLQLPSTNEPNDTFEEAFPIKPQQSYVSGLSSATDIDYYTYTAETTGVDRVTLTVPKDQNYNLYVYDASRNLIAAGIKETGIQENVLYDVSAGQRYFIKIFGVAGSSGAGSYTLSAGNVNIKFQSNYEYDNNGNLIKKTTTGTN
ncbi:Kelch repeat-containing protein [Paenibacillus chitinolyticus]|uniref:Kelch repeat-containing protein n=1 Tax=Paenibacillus chitinolyticus TaxID=79263 RepID=UPI00362FF623